MALTFSTNLHRGQWSHKSEGLVTAIVEMTTSTGSGGADYASGFAIQANATQFGFRQVVGVFVVGARTSADAFIALGWNYNPVTGRLQGFSTVTGTGATEITSQIAANGIVRMVVLGV